MNTNQDSENRLLAILIAKPETFHEIADRLHHELFNDVTNKIIFNAVEEVSFSTDNLKRSSFVLVSKVLIQNSATPDVLQQLNKIKNDYPYYNVEDIELLIESLSVLYKKREANKIGLDIVQAAKKGKDIETIKEYVDQLQNILFHDNKGEKPVSLEDAFDELEQHIFDKTKGIPTGIALLDKYMGGWSSLSNVLIAARPGMGKTTFMVQLIIKAAEAGFPVAFVSLEERSSSVMARMISHYTGIEYGDILRKAVTPSQWDEIKKVKEKIKNLPVYIYDSSRSSDINDMMNILTVWKKKYDIQIVIGDHISIMMDRSSKNNRNEELTKISDKVRLWQSKYAIPFILGSQLNREVDKRPDKRPKLSDLRDSGSLEQNASVVIFLYRDDYYTKKAANDPDFIPKNTIEIDFAKFRLNVPEVFELGIDVGKNRIYQLDTFEKVNDEPNF